MTALELSRPLVGDHDHALTTTVRDNPGIAARTPARAHAPRLR